MKILVALVLALSCSAQIAVPYLAAPYPWAIKYQGVDGLGQATFGHQSIDQNRHEVRLADGSVVGQYSYINEEGEPAVTYYVAGRAGYNVVGSNVLPEGPPADYVPEYTEEVALARAQFFAAFEEAREADPEPESTFIAGQPGVEEPVPVAEAEPEVAEYFPEYTEEVALARAQFFATFEEAKAGSPKSESTFTAGQPAEEEPAPVAEAEPEVAAEEEKPALSIAVETAGEPEPVAEPAAEEESISRRSRSVASIPLPYLAAVPTETKTTIETKQFESVDAPTPAATKKIELTTKEHVFRVPGFKYVQPSVGIQPAQYSLLTPQVAPFAPIFYPGFGYPFAGVAPASPKEE